MTQMLWYLYLDTQNTVWEHLVIPPTLCCQHPEPPQHLPLLFLCCHPPAFQASCSKSPSLPWPQEDDDAPVDAESWSQPESAAQVATRATISRHLLLDWQHCHNCRANEPPPKRALVFCWLLAEVMALSFHRAQHTGYNATFWSPAREKKKIKRVLLGLCGVFYPLSLFPERCDTNQLDTQIRGDLISPLGLKQDHHLGGDVLARYHWLACEQHYCGGTNAAFITQARHGSQLSIHPCKLFGCIEKWDLGAASHTHRSRR